MEFLPTKGIEYLLVIAYLPLLVAAWWMIRRTTGSSATLATARSAAAATGRTSRFEVPENTYFHPGHTWAVPEGDGIFRVGLDDFARRLLGRPDVVRLPNAGDSLDQGESGWRLDVDGRTVELLSPVGGEVAAVNEEVSRRPGLVSEDPYGEGWLLKIRASRPEGTLKNLLSGRLARAWIADTSRRLAEITGGELGVVMQDGGDPVMGFGRQLDPDQWQRVAADLLLTSSTEHGSSP